MCACVCAALTVCTVGEQFESVAPTATSNRVCRGMIPLKANEFSLVIFLKHFLLWNPLYLSPLRLPLSPQFPLISLSSYHCSHPRVAVHFCCRNWFHRQRDLKSVTHSHALTPSHKQVLLDSWSKEKIVSKTEILKSSKLPEVPEVSQSSTVGRSFANRRNTQG